MPGLVGHLAGRPLEIDAPVQPVHAQRDGVLDAAAGDREPGLLEAEAERQRHDHLQGVALGAAIGRRVGLAGAGALGSDAQALDQLRRHARAVVGDRELVAVDGDDDHGVSTPASSQASKALSISSLTVRAEPVAPRAAHALGELGLGRELEVAREREDGARAHAPAPPALATARRPRWRASVVAAMREMRGAGGGRCRQELR